MVKRVLVSAGLVLLALLVGVLAGCGSKSSTSTSTTMTSSSSAPFDRAFIDAMVPHHRSAIEMAQAAQKAGLSSPELNSVALSIVDSQQQEIGQMLTWRQKWYGSKTLDPNAGDELGMSMSEMGMGGHMSDLQGSNVDKPFAAMMVAHHEGAIRMAQLALTKAQHPELKALARRIIAAQQREVKIMKPFAHMSADKTMTGMNMG